MVYLWKMGRIVFLCGERPLVAWLSLEEQSLHSADESTLLALAKAGDEKAFMALYRKYYAVVYRFCQTFGGIDSDTAKDILQETFVRAFRHLRNLREGQKFLSWLLTITRNRCLSHLTKEDSLCKKHQAWSAENALFSPPDEAEILETERQIQIVHDVIAGLEEGGMKACVEGFYIEGLSTSEIAERLEIPKSTVTTRLDRFRNRVRKRLLAKLMES
jgi:RNA polymerase sigma-70 factor (ECF subfamily)